MLMDERFWSKVEKGDGCWLWTGAIATTGYGVIRAPRPSGVLIGAHRYSLLLHTGPVDSRLQALHHCDVRACVRPDHLYWGDHAQNMRDMVERGRTNPKDRGKPACIHGHAFDEANTYVDKRGFRHCRKCALARYHARKSTVTPPE